MSCVNCNPERERDINYEKATQAAKDQQKWMAIYTDEEGQKYCDAELAQQLGFRIEKYISPNNKNT